MRIVKFQAENIKKLRAVEITPNGAVIEIVGPNGSGKSSVLDAIFWGLSGANEIPPQVVRQGEEKAFVKLDLGKLIVTRHFSKDGTTKLTVDSAEGARFPSPQAMLDKLIGALSFDPLEFIRMEPKAQLETLKKMAGVKAADELKDKARAKQDARNSRGREARQLEAQLIGIPAPPEGTPDEPVDVQALVKELNDAGKKNLSLQQERTRRTAVATRAAQLIKQSEELREQAAEVLKRAAMKEDEAKLLNDTVNQLPPVEVDVNTQELTEQIATAQRTNKAVDAKKKRSDIESAIKVLRNQASENDLAASSLMVEYAKVIAAAPMPIEGLSLGNDGVMYNNLPLGNASSAEQLRVSVAIAMAANPKLRVLRIKDGSLLDVASLQLLQDSVRLNNYQLWLERVEADSARPCVIMEDGAIIGEQPESV